MRASGPGGQNVNKVATAVQLRFDIGAPRRYPAQVKARLIALAGNRVTDEGVLVLDSQRASHAGTESRGGTRRLVGLLGQATIQAPDAPGHEAREGGERASPDREEAAGRPEERTHGGQSRRRLVPPAALCHAPSATVIECANHRHENAFPSAWRSPCLPSLPARQTGLHLRPTPAC